MALAALLAVFDVFAIYEAFVMAFAIRASNHAAFRQPMAITQFAGLVGLLSPAWIVIFAAVGLYGIEHRRSAGGEFGRIVVAVLLGVMTLVVIDYMGVTQPIFPGRSVPVYAFLLGVGFVFVCRLFIRGILRAVYSRGRGRHRVVLIGTGDLAQRIAQELNRPGSGYEIVAIVSEWRHAEFPDDAIPMFPDLDSALATSPDEIDEIVQADVDIDRDEVARLMSLANSRGITYRFVPDQYGVYAATSTMATVDGIPVMEVRLTALDGWSAVAKRAFDLVCTVLLTLLLSPLFLAIALTVKITDPAGPVFYRQLRIGRYGRPVRIIKFRSMGWKYSTGPHRDYASPIDAFRAMARLDLVDEFERSHKVRDDPRVTRVGHMLRRTSLDELPQLFNVLSGKLSLIGPRPVTEEELTRYGSQRSSYLALKPGMTGLWQVSGRSDVSYAERVKLDLFYIENWSISLDARILAKTPAAVLARRGAA